MAAAWDTSFQLMKPREPCVCVCPHSPCPWRGWGVLGAAPPCPAQTLLRAMAGTRVTLCGTEGIWEPCVCVCVPHFRPRSGAQRQLRGLRAGVGSPPGNPGLSQRGRGLSGESAVPVLTPKALALGGGKLRLGGGLSKPPGRLGGMRCSPNSRSVRPRGRWVSHPVSPTRWGRSRGAAPRITPPHPPSPLFPPGYRDRSEPRC